MDSSGYCMDFFCLSKKAAAIYRLDAGSYEKMISSRPGVSDDKNTENRPVVSLIHEWQDVEIGGFSPCFNYLYLVYKEKLEQICLLDTTTFKLLGNLTCESPIRKVDFSSKSSYMIVLCKSVQASNDKNLTVWKLSGFEEICRIHWRPTVESSWPALLWSNDDNTCVQKRGNSCFVFPDFVGDINTDCFFEIKEQKINSVSLSPTTKTSDILVATFTPVIKEYPAAIKVFSVSKLKNKDNNPVHSMNTFKCQDVEFKWSYDASALLAIARMDSDSSGKSYYGTSTLHFLKIGDGNKFVNLVEEQKGPVHEVSWSPTKNEFILSVGPMPPQLFLYDGVQGVALAKLETARRNTIRWSLCGNRFILAGFGNLAGDLDIWDRTKKTKIGATNVSCGTLCEFSNDGKFFITATTSPRLRIDNNVQIFLWTGELIFSQDIDDLYTVTWRRQKDVQYPQFETKKLVKSADRSVQSPVRVYRPPRSLQSANTPARDLQDNFPLISSTSVPGANSIVPKKKAPKRKNKKIQEKRLDTQDP